MRNGWMGLVLVFEIHVEDTGPTDDKLHGQDRERHDREREDDLVGHAPGVGKGRVDVREVCRLTVREDVLVVVQRGLEQQYVV